MSRLPISMKRPPKVSSSTPARCAAPVSELSTMSTP
ncbi:Uncharacterised protein [Mycobacteroides abscessus subsp. abscessus]|nr:Uncharacterised protein [Mycobacteroides abscessus subsp. abscessus]